MEGSLKRKKKMNFQNNKLLVLTQDINKNISKHDIARNLKLKLTKKYEF